MPIGTAAKLLRDRRLNSRTSSKSLCCDIAGGEFSEDGIQRTLFTGHNTAGWAHIRREINPLLSLRAQELCHLLLAGKHRCHLDAWEAFNMTTSLYNYFEPILKADHVGGDRSRNLTQTQTNRCLGKNAPRPPDL